MTDDRLAPCGHVWEGKGGTCTQYRCLGRMLGPVKIRDRWHCTGVATSAHAGVYFDEEGHVEPLWCPVCNRVAGAERLRATLRDVAKWARGRQKLDDAEAEQGGEEFCDIASKCEQAIE